MAECLGVADGEGEVHLVGDELPWVDATRQDRTGGHFPGVYKGHTEVSKVSSEKPVHLESEPVTWTCRVLTSLMTRRVQPQGPR